MVAQTLGRPLSGGTANTTVNLLNPGQRYGDRVTQLDFRVAKILRFGRTRTNVGIDLYNVTNSSVPLTYNNTYGATWLRPTDVHAGAVREAHGAAQFLTADARCISFGCTRPTSRRVTYRPRLPIEQTTTVLRGLTR